MAGLLLVAATDRELFAVEGADQLCCGIGPIEAAVHTGRALAAARYHAVLHVGIAGATKLKPGAVVIGSETVYCDVLDPRTTLPRVHRLAAPSDLIEAARDAIPHAHVLAIATCARVGGGSACEVEAMEGFGVLRAAALAGVAALEVRVISNPVRERDRARWRLDHALETLSDVVARLVPALLSAAAI